MDTLELLLHPARMRIVHAMSSGRTRTTSDLCALLPDVPKTSVYRHVGLLVDAGVLEVVREQRVRGAVERHYRISAERPVIGAEDAASMSPEDHRRAFAAAMAILLAEFYAYLDRDGADPIADSVGYRQGVVWLSPDEVTKMLADMLSVVRTNVGNKPAPGRSPRLISMIHFPIGEPSPDVRAPG